MHADKSHAFFFFFFSFLYIHYPFSRASGSARSNKKKSQRRREPFTKEATWTAQNKRKKKGEGEANRSVARPEKGERSVSRIDMVVSLFRCTGERRDKLAEYSGSRSIESGLEYKVQGCNYPPKSKVPEIALGRDGIDQGYISTDGLIYLMPQRLRAVIHAFCWVYKTECVYKKRDQLINGIFVQSFTFKDHTLCRVL